MSDPRVEAVAAAIRKRDPRRRWFGDEHYKFIASEALAAADAAAEAATERDGDIMRIIADPKLVHLNMLRGTIAKPSVADIVHLYGVEALSAAIAAAPKIGGRR